MSIIGGVGLTKRLERNDFKGGLVITPILDQTAQISADAVDVRLGNEFIATQRSHVHSLDPNDREAFSRAIVRHQRKIHVPYGRSFILHPTEFVLASTLEYVAMPGDLSAYVIGRSSWGRLGLIIATATKVNPGFKGCITLELSNVGSLPIVLYPCVRIAQLVFHDINQSGGPSYHD